MVPLLVSVGGYYVGHLKISTLLMSLLNTLSLRLTEYNSGSIRPTTRYLESEADGIQQWLYTSYY